MSTTKARRQVTWEAPLKGRPDDPQELVPLLRGQATDEHLGGTAAGHGHHLLGEEPCGAQEPSPGGCGSARRVTSMVFAHQRLRTAD